MDGPRVQAMFKRSRHNNLFIFIISQYYHELSKKQYAVLVKTTIYSNQTTSEMLKISLKRKLRWT